MFIVPNNHSHIKRVINFYEKGINEIRILQTAKTTEQIDISTKILKKNFKSSC